MKLATRCGSVTSQLAAQAAVTLTAIVESPDPIE
jgi:hypothetical protein